MKTKTEKRPVLILDTHRGIYFGYLEKMSNEGKTVFLKNARHCFYFSASLVNDRGVYALATVGPQAGSKIGPRVKMMVNDVSKVVEVTPEAVSNWESAKW